MSDKVKRYKKYEDHLYALQEQFPDFSIEDLKIIIRYGSTILYNLLCRNADLLFISNVKDFKFKFLVSRITFQSVAHKVRYIINKAAIRFKFLYQRRKTKWDGYYYFGLTEKGFQNYQAQMSSWFKSEESRRRRYKNSTFNYGEVMLYRIFDECKLNAHYIHFFRVPIMFLRGFRIYEKEYISKKAEYIARRTIDGYENMIIEHKNKLSKF